MNVNEFVQRREADWKRLETLLKRTAIGGQLNAAEVHELGVLYRAVASDLALARRDYGNHRVTVFLNQLLTRTHSFIYREDTSDLRQFGRFFTHTAPQVFRRTFVFTLAAFILFFGPALFGYRLAYANPEAADIFGLSLQRATLADHETWTDIPIEERPATSAFIMSNNIRIAILAFAGGLAFGLFSVYVLIFNGLLIGAVFGLAAHYGMAQEMLSFVVGHGVIELSVVIMAGGAGLQLGWALLNPGLYRRRDAVALSARRAVALAVIAVPLLVIAGLIEGFFSPSALPLSLHIAVGVVTGLLLYAYLALAGRRAEADASPLR